MEQEQQGAGRGGTTGAVWESKAGEYKIEEETGVVGEEDEERAGGKQEEETEGWVELVV